MNFALVFALSFGGLRPAAPPADSWLGPDKIKHFMMSAFVEGVSYSALRAAKVSHNSAVDGAIGVTAVFGVGKEFHDRHTAGDFSVKDLAWDAAGAAAMAAAISHAR